MTFPLLSVFIVLAAQSEPPMDAPRPQAAVELPQDPGRFRSPYSYDETLDYYQRVFKNTTGVRWRNVVNLPSVKAKHIDCLRKKTHWDGINIYEKQGEVRIYVLPRESPEKDGAAAPAKARTGK